MSNVYLEENNVLTIMPEEQMNRAIGLDTTTSN